MNNTVEILNDTKEKNETYFLRDYLIHYSDRLLFLMLLWSIYYIFLKIKEICLLIATWTEEKMLLLNEMPNKILSSL